VGDIKSRIELANRRVVELLARSQPVWIGCRPALEVIPGMTRETILHAGPPIAWDRMCNPMRKGIQGALIYERLAGDLDEAARLAGSGRIKLAPCHDYGAVGGMTGITSASMPVNVVRDEVSGTLAYCASHEGASPHGFGWGTCDEATVRHARWIQEELGPVLDAGLRSAGGVNMKQVVGRAIQMGDEDHGRCGAATLLLTRELAPHVVRLDLPKEVLGRVMDFLLSADIFALHVIMAAARATVEPAKNIPYSSVVTTMARNGVEFGIKVSALGDRWFTGPAQRIQTVFFSPEWTDADATPDIGDSSIVETIGLGGLIHAAAPVAEFGFGGSYADAVRKTEQAYAFCAGEHEAWTIPNLDFRGVPLGIDIRKVLQTGVAPILDTATAHKDGGKIGIGEARAPMEAFESALRAFSKQVESETAKG
jgi:Protein of unknown function (DUF1116)